jgi:hypothetical protein
VILLKDILKKKLAEKFNLSRLEISLRFFSNILSNKEAVKFPFLLLFVFSKAKSWLFYTCEINKLHAQLIKKKQEKLLILLYNNDLTSILKNYLSKIADKASLYPCRPKPLITPLQATAVYDCALKASLEYIFDK